MLSKNEKENILEKYHKSITALCVSHKVKTLHAIGSVLTDKFRSDSDIDLVVDFHPLDVLEYGDNYYELKFSLENILKREIDLLEQKALKNPYFLKEINQTKRLIYG